MNVANLHLKKKRACLACSGFVDELLKADYLPVEPVQLEVLDDKEIEGVDIRQTLNFAEYAKAISQATIALNEAKFGQLYRVKGG